MRARVFLLAAALAVAAGCGQSAYVSTPPIGGGWAQFADLPLGKRTAPVVAWTGREVLAVGGEIGTECLPMGDCNVLNTAARDGAALDPVSGKWRPLADAPLPIPAYHRGVIVSGHLFVRVDRVVLDYEVARDRWRVLPRPVSPWYDLTADGDRLVLVSGSDEQGVRPDLLDRKAGRWTRLPVSDQLGGGRWAVNGDRLVDPTPGSADGGGPEPGDYGREVPSGGVLDLRARRWERLPDPPQELTGGWVVDAAGDRLVAAAGWLYDDARRSWHLLPRPPTGPHRPGPAVWAGDQLVVVTGERRGRDWDDVRDLRVWSWRPTR